MPSRSERVRANSRFASATTTESTPASRHSVCAWNEPIRPAPATPIRTSLLLAFVALNLVPRSKVTGR